MAHTSTGWHRSWVELVENVLGRVAAIVIGFIMMVIGLGLSVTMVMLPVGVAIGLTGVAIFVGGLFAHVGSDT